MRVGLAILTIICSVLILINPLTVLALEAEDITLKQEACDRFKEVISGGLFHRGEVGLTGLNTSGNPRMSLSVGSFYVRDENALFGLLTIRKDAEKYMGILQLHPDVMLVNFVEDTSPKDSFPAEIQGFIEGLTHATKIHWKKELGHLSKGHDDKCYPLARTIPGIQFEDGLPRKFIRHFTYGQSISVGRSEHLGCGEWNYNNKQFRFYETFTPLRLDINGVHVYVDGKYLGSSAGNEFEYACNFDDYLDGRIIKADEEGGDPERTQEFLARIGLGHLAEPEFYYLHQWELQVLRNIREGEILFDQKTIKTRRN